MNGARRIEARNGRRRQAMQADLPKFFRPKVSEAQQRTARVIHWDLIDRFTNGTATREDLWDWMETGYTYSLMVNLLVQDGVELTDEAVQAIAAQLDIYQAVADRFARSGRPGFTGPELAIARTAAEVMDGLITLDRHGTLPDGAAVNDNQQKGAA
ncbi:MAG TPA: hypothetical protein VEA40_00550 [Ramlibacter sp.]|nr:hypothetical protein [Ramlibacter sp.]